MSEKPAGARQKGNGLYHCRRKIEVEKNSRNRHGDVHRQVLFPGFRDSGLRMPGKLHMDPGNASLLRQSENAFGAWIDRLVQGMSKTGNFAAVGMNRLCHGADDGFWPGSLTGRFFARFHKEAAA